ncbi:LysR family transcriptional regulator [Aureimonas endophytica]|uniref:LysR family transcriptional regulator n=1 Tax=Aureimonas endophytica TaxID=2027858 RepID=A0A917A2Y7_9HYPH|nr:LysR substrate-binding domain-containing protein [Aureimonas endophytica]GGE22643.1 LysR family transcriptional regulator [Aureimonas endophytica]
MDVRQLRYFVAIVESGSISRAAQRLNVAQPSLSLHIRNMEADLGVPLLFRTPQGVQATEAGEILLRNARTIVAQFEEAEREIRGSGLEPAGEVRLGLPSSIAQVLGVPLVLAAREQLPKVKLRIAEAMSGYVLDWLRLGRVDLGLLYAFVEDRGLRSIGLLSEALHLFGPAGDPDEDALPPAGAPVPIGALAGLPLILPSPGHGLRDLVEEKAAAEGARLGAAIEIDAYGAIKTLVERGLGFSVLPAHAIRRETEDGRLRAWPFEPAFLRTVHLVEPIDRPLSQAVRAVESLCRRTLRDLVRSGAWSGAQMRVSG